MNDAKPAGGGAYRKMRSRDRVTVRVNHASVSFHMMDSSDPTKDAHFNAEGEAQEVMRKFREFLDTTIRAKTK